MPAPELEQEAEKQLLAILERAVSWTATEGREILATEERFHGLPMTFGKNWTLRMQGSIDRVDKLPDGSIAVLDYKTGDPEKLKSELARHWQHYLYTVAEEQLHAGRKVERAGYLFLQEEAKLLQGTEIEALRELFNQRIAWVLDQVADEARTPECKPCYTLKKTTVKAGGHPGEMDRDGTASTAAVNGCRNWCEFAIVCPKAGRRA